MVGMDCLAALELRVLLASPDVHQRKNPKFFFENSEFLALARRLPSHRALRALRANPDPRDPLETTAIRVRREIRDAPETTEPQVKARISTIKNYKKTPYNS